MFQQGVAVLSKDVWVDQKKNHIQEVEQVVSPLTRGSRHGKSHPVYDFLFDYYNFRLNQHKRWSPGWKFFLEGATPEEFPICTSFDERGGRISLEVFPEKRLRGVDWIVQLLGVMTQRHPRYSCFGLHEWAMVYKTDTPRYTVKLRLTHKEIKDVVESLPLRCTHYDAFRFFTPSAVPLNLVELTQENRIQYDQPGCIHANMDLYKWAYKFYPWISSKIILEAFKLTLKARILDMRASPYDLSRWRFSPICIETSEGRAAYEEAQRELTEEAKPIREDLLRELKAFRKALTLTS